MKSPLMVCSLLGLLTACGGGGGGNDNPVIAASVNAGVDQQIIEKSEFTIEAKGSPVDGTYTWQRVSGPIVEGFPLEGASQTVLAPDIKADSELVLRVNYQSPDGKLVSDDVLISIQSNNQLPQAVVTQTAPTILPSVYQDTITLSAATSIDPDENGSISSYNWQKIAGPTLEISDYKSQTISFTHPLLDKNTTVIWQLTVVDDEGGEASTQHTHILNKTNNVVIAKAGEDQSVIELEKVTLNATNSEVVTTTFNCQWEQTVGSVSLDNQDQCITSFIAPTTDAVNTMTFEVTVTDSQGRSDSDTVDVVVNSKPLGLINDTGMAKCFNNTQEIACTSPDFPRQDAALGRDSVVGTHIDKVGKGELAFDFTKLNEFADEIADDAADFSCIRDNVSGLIWEVKSPNTGTLPSSTQLREGQNHYTWYLTSSNGIQQGSVAGSSDTCSTISHCGLQAYVDAVNSLDYCGGTNWRVPTYSELLSLLDYSKQGQSVLIDSDFFPNTPSVSLLTHLRYWSAQTAADGTSLSQAYIIDMNDGNDLAYPKNNTAFVRLVRTAGESQ
ncbi:PKD domain-containing protein [Pseudoalteromonas sp. Ld20]|uniref:Lcl C-terminal domain-containing protein n=1 Tax=Pseudoalteromonas sp. Ld20 TaxID=649165 RepID=UPI00386A1FE6